MDTLLHPVVLDCPYQKSSARVEHSSFLNEYIEYIQLYSISSKSVGILVGI